MFIRLSTSETQEISLKLCKIPIEKYYYLMSTSAPIITRLVILKL